MAIPAKSSSAHQGIESLERRRPPEESERSKEAPEEGVESAEEGQEAESQTPEEIEKQKLQEEEREAIDEAEKTQRIEEAEFSPDSLAQKQTTESLGKLRDLVEGGTQASVSLEKLSGGVEGLQKEMTELAVESKEVQERIALEGATPENTRKADAFAGKMKELQEKAEKLFEEGEAAIKEVAAEAQKEGSQTSSEAVDMPARFLREAMKDLTGNVTLVAEKWGETAAKVGEVSEKKQKQEGEEGSPEDASVADAETLLDEAVEDVPVSDTDTAAPELAA
jgi:hypothetical protein